jgi:hypothetical protein
LERSKASIIELHLLKSENHNSNVTLSKAAAHHEQTAKALRTATQQPKVKYKVRYIASPADIPAGQLRMAPKADKRDINHVLVEYGAESGQKRHALGFTITVARNQSTSDLAFLANVHAAKELAKRESISAIFACKL